MIYEIIMMVSRENGGKFRDKLSHLSDARMTQRAYLRGFRLRSRSKTTLPMFFIAHLMGHGDNMDGLKIFDDLKDDAIRENITKHATIWGVNNAIMLRRIPHFSNPTVDFRQESLSQLRINFAIPPGGGGDFYTDRGMDN